MDIAPKTYCLQNQNKKKENVKLNYTLSVVCTKIQVKREK